MADFSVGIEEEFFIVDPSTRALAPGYMDLFAASENAGIDAIELKEELHTSVVEVGTPVCSDIDEARHEIAGLRGKLDRLARQVDLRIAAVSTHPFSRWED